MFMAGKLAQQSLPPHLTAILLGHLAAVTTASLSVVMGPLLAHGFLVLLMYMKYLPQ